MLDTGKFMSTFSAIWLAVNLGLFTVPVLSIKSRTSFLHVSLRPSCNFSRLLNAVVVFEAPGALVVESGNTRRLVFRHASSHGSSCRLEAEVQCGFDDITAQSNATLDAPLPQDASCDARSCLPDGRNVGLDYVRSMLGGAVSRAGQDIKAVASIGLGAGTIPLWFKAQFPSVHVDAVDLSSEVIDAAGCFGLQQQREPDSVRLIEADGRSFLTHQPNATYDIIFVDVFDALDYTPDCFVTVEFFQMLSKRLRPNGVLSMNVWHRQIHDILPSILAAFDGHVEMGSSPDSQNMIVLAGLRPLQAATTTVLADAVRWSEDADFQAVKVKDNTLQLRAGSHAASVLNDFLDLAHRPLRDSVLCRAWS